MQKFEKFSKYLVTLAFVVSFFLIWTLPYIATLYDSPITELIIKILVSYQLVWAIYFILSAGSLGQKSISYLLVSTSFLIGLCLLELLAVAGFDYRRPFGNQISYYLSEFNIVGRKIVYTHVPHYRLHGKKLGGDLYDNLGAPPHKLYEWDITLDRDGFRNAGEIYQPEIAILGDSFLEGVRIEDKDWISDILSKKLNKKIRTYALGGQGPNSQLEIMKKYVLKDKPKKLIWFFFEGNDYRDDIMFWEDWQKNMDLRLAELTHIRKRLFSKNALNALDRLLRPRDFVSPLADSYNCEVRANGQSWSKQYFLFPLQELTSDYDGLGKIAKIWSQAWSILEKENIELDIVFIPVKFRVYQNFCSIDHRSKMLTWKVNELPEKLKRITQKISPNIGFVDLTSSLQAAVSSGEDVYYPDDTHWNESGHLISARKLLKYYGIKTE